MADTTASTLADIQALLAQRGVSPNSAENLNRAMLLLRGGPDEGFINDRLEAYADGLPGSGSAPRPRAQPGTRQTSTNTPQPAPVRQDTAGGSSGVGRGAASGTAAATASPAAAVSVPTTLNLTGEGGEQTTVGVLNKPEGDKSQLANIAGADVDVSTEGGTNKGTQSSAQGAAEAKAAALSPLPAEPGQFNGQASPELLARLQAGDQPLPFTASPFDYLAAGGAGAAIGTARQALPSLIGALARSQGLGARPGQSPLPTTGQPYGPPASSAPPVQPNPWASPRTSVPNAGGPIPNPAAGNTAPPAPPGNPWARPTEPTPRPVAPDLPSPIRTNSPNVEIVPPTLPRPQMAPAAQNVSPDTVAGVLRELLSRPPSPSTVVPPRNLPAGSQPVSVPLRTPPEAAPPPAPPRAGPSPANVVAQEERQAARVLDANRTGANARNRLAARQGVRDDVRSPAPGRQPARRGYGARRGDD